MKMLKFYSPVKAYFFDEDEEIPVVPTVEMRDQINLRIFNEDFYNLKEMADYSDIEGVIAIHPRVFLDETSGYQLYCETVVWLSDTFKINEESIRALKLEISGQYSDGWGEGFEQNPIAAYGNLYVRFWWGDNDWYIFTNTSIDSFLQKKCDKLPPSVSEIKSGLASLLEEIESLLPKEEE